MSSCSNRTGGKTLHAYASVLGLVLLQLWFLLALPGYAQTTTIKPPAEVMLSEAIRLAEELHPELAAARLEIRAAEGRTVQASLRPNPDISFEAENFGGQGERDEFESTEYTTLLEQVIETGGKRGKRVRVAESERQLTVFDLEAMLLDVRSETTRHFVAVQGAQEQVALASESVDLAQEFLHAATARVKAGKVSPMEEEKARILLSEAEIAMNAAQKRFDAARVQLSAMWGDPGARFERVVGNLNVVAPLPPLSDLAGRIPANPDLARWPVEMEQRQAVLAQEKTASIPDLTIAGGIRRFADTNSDAFVAGLSIPLPVFNRNQGRVCEANALVEKAEQQRQAAEVTVAANLVAAYEVLSVAFNRVSVLRDEVLPRSRTVYETVQSGYSQGKFTYLDALDARRVFLDSRSDYIEALVTYHQAVADVERIIGGALAPANSD